uniref:Uncharacterized protein n=1 Tax=Rhizophora mucronata TaxID=61149 RepID=A0A2P2QNP1_RHIMU
MHVCMQCMSANTICTSPNELKFKVSIHNNNTITTKFKSQI